MPVAVRSSCCSLYTRKAAFSLKTLVLNPNGILSHAAEAFPCAIPGGQPMTGQAGIALIGDSWRGGAWTQKAASRPALFSRTQGNCHRNNVGEAADFWRWPYASSAPFGVGRIRAAAPVGRGATTHLSPRAGSDMRRRMSAPGGGDAPWASAAGQRRTCQDRLCLVCRAGALTGSGFSRIWRRTRYYGMDVTLRDGGGAVASLCCAVHAANMGKNTRAARARPLKA